MTFPSFHYTAVRRLLLLGIVVMFVASSIYVFRDLNLVLQPQRPQSQAPEVDQDNSGMGFALSAEANGELGLLMMNLQGNPNDVNTLLQIAEIFMSAEEWGRAESFIQKAMVSAPKNGDARIFYAITRFQQNDPQGAATALEELLSFSPDEPVAMFNLATIYKHNLDKKDQATKIFKEILKSNKAEADILEMSKKELES